MENSRIRGLRIKRGLTQEQLAERVGVSRVSIGFYERWRIPPTKTIDRIADALGVPSAYLISGNTDENDDSGARWDQARAELERAGCEVEPLPNGQVRVYHTAQRIVDAEISDIQAVIESILSDAEDRRMNYIKHRLAAELPYITRSD